MSRANRGAPVDSATAHKGIRRRLASLALGELGASVVFVFALISIHVNTDLAVNGIVLYPFGLLIFILLQGSYYWFYRLRVLTQAGVDRDRFRFVYRAFRTVDLALILLYPVCLVVLFLINRAAFAVGSTLLGLFLYGFGIVEYVNYFYIRLSFSRLDDMVSLLTLTNIQRSSLNRELARSPLR